MVCTQGKTFRPQAERSGFWLAKKETVVEEKGARVGKPLVLLALERAVRWHVSGNKNRSFRIMRANNRDATTMDYMQLTAACVWGSPETQTRTNSKALTLAQLRGRTLRVCTVRAWAVPFRRRLTCVACGTSPSHWQG